MPTRYKGCKCSSIYEWIKKYNTHTHMMECHSDFKKKGILSFATTWVNLTGVMLSEISQTQEDKYHIQSHLHVEPKE